MIYEELMKKTGIYYGPGRRTAIGAYVGSREVEHGVRCWQPEITRACRQLRAESLHSFTE